MLVTRTATESDAALIASQREAMFRDMGRGDNTTLATITRHFTPWVKERLANGKYLGWITEDEGKPVAGAGLLLLDWAPNPRDPAGITRGYLLNVYVEPAYRRRGLAKALTSTAMDECMRRGIRVMSLHASDAGRPLYERLGWIASNEMLWRANER